MKLKRSLFSILGPAVTAAALAGQSAAAQKATVATPDEIRQHISNSTAPITLVHVWATWCDPCRDEFPELVDVINQFPTLNCILISADNPSEKIAVEKFLQNYKSPVDSLISTELSQNFIETLSLNWSGALPATFIFQNGKCVSEWEGKRSSEEYTKQIEQLKNNMKGANS